MYVGNSFIFDYLRQWFPEREKDGLPKVEKSFAFNLGEICKKRVTEYFAVQKWGTNNIELGTLQSALESISQSRNKKYKLASSYFFPSSYFKQILKLI